MKIEHEFPLTRRRAGRKPHGETESSGSKTTAKHRGYKQVYGESSSSSPDDGGLHGLYQSLIQLLFLCPLYTPVNGITRLEQNHRFYNFLVWLF